MELLIAFVMVEASCEHLHDLIDHLPCKVLPFPKVTVAIHPREPRLFAFTIHEGHKLWMIFELLNRLWLQAEDHEDFAEAVIET